MATSIEGVYVLLRSRGVQQEQEAKPTGMLEVRFVGRFLKVRETPNGLVVSDDRTILLRPVLSLHIPTQQLLDPASHQSLICGAVSTLNLPRFLCCSHDHLVKGIASRASNLAAGPRGGFVGYSLRVELQLVKIVQFAGASRNAVEKLIEKNGFVAEKSDEELDTCSICLAELSSADGAELLRMDCSHLYHQRCLLTWLEKQSTCPLCRREVEEEYVHASNFLLFHEF
jgi:hypothetical protein